MAVVELTSGSARTPDAAPWSNRRHEQRRQEGPRSNYDVDRDRIVHSSAFRDLQYKTQVQSLLARKPFVAFRTRLNHVLEVSQIARGLARLVGADEAQCEAIALAHDLGHPPFGHAGERALGDALRRQGRDGWNANVHSLEVVDRVEEAFVAFRGLDLTYAVREGIARHSTPFDEPVSFGEFAGTPNGGLECQIVDVADVFAYISHDLDDAIAAEFVSFDDLGALTVVRELLDHATSNWDDASPPAWPDGERAVVIRKSVVATLIYRLINDTATHTLELLAEHHLESAEAVRAHADRVVIPVEPHERLVRELLSVLVRLYYRSPDVAGADEAAQRLVTDLVDGLVAQPESVPERFRDGDPVANAATYVASLNDFAAADLARSQGLHVAGD